MFYNNKLKLFQDLYRNYKSEVDIKMTYRKISYINYHVFDIEGLKVFIKEKDDVAIFIDLREYNKFEKGQVSYTGRLTFEEAFNRIPGQMRKEFLYNLDLFV